MKFQEKRKSLRFPVQLPVDFGHGDYFMSSLCSDLSAHGLRMETSEEFTPGKKISIFISLPHREDPLKVVGKVTWVEPVNCRDFKGNPMRTLGVQFIRPLPGWIRLPDGNDLGSSEGVVPRDENEDSFPRTYVN